jgi:ABC-2 type transport system permease protein
MALVTMVVNALAAQVSGLSAVRPLSPFHWYLEPDPLTHAIEPVNVLMLVGIAVVGFAVALVAFDRRNLAA